MNQDPRYTDLMQEIKERLYVIEDVLSGKTGFSGALANEICFLQLRMICECITYACVIAHEYIDELQAPRIQKGWSADALLKILDGLHQDFYPQPKKITVVELQKSVQLDDIDTEYLTKEDLKKLNGICGDKLHRGSPEKYTYNPTAAQLAIDRQTIIDFANKTFRLMESYLMSNRDKPRYILCRFKERGTPVVQLKLSG